MPNTTPPETGLVDCGTWYEVAPSCAWDGWGGSGRACWGTPWASPSYGGVWGAAEAICSLLWKL